MELHTRVRIIGPAEPPYEQWYRDGVIDSGTWADYPDASHGYSLEDLLQVGAPETEPADFDDFWAGRLAEALGVDPDLQIQEVNGSPEFIRYQGTFASVGGRRIGCWVVLPRDGEVRIAKTVLHGYGGRTDAPVADVRPGEAVIFPVLRGQPTLSLDPEIKAMGTEHVLHGIESRDSYVIGGCVADVWVANTALLGLLGALGAKPEIVALQGGSFGGGIGSLAMIDRRFERAAFSVPTFGNQPLRVTLPCRGSGSSVTRHHADHPEVLEVLAYFDAATAAKRATQPVLCSTAQWDPAVPPAGQFAVANSFPNAEHLVVPGGHCDWPESQAHLAEVAHAFEEFLAR
ncbi:acetylxylan esterase [Parenemella sanctibonifatiensis]|uniref:Acetylxylan esterase n=1 Tax=Parenemella sanctibonifatiensis TaxID=2016505 RepID=A0A255EI87_9ACTN|nr:acetylxylan esterase [Parenemella sanctibonifatiensis]OYN91234.1 acetylxylan esterase [Parenemella sanctibonifatiensis]